MKKGLLIINLGTPRSTKFFSVWGYLSVFLMDRRVISLPFFLRIALVYGLILPFRTHKTQHAYKLIWNKGSPLLNNSLSLEAKLAKKTKALVALAMRYSKPSIKEALSKLSSCESITIIPLYPQYSSAASGSALEAVFKELQSLEVVPEIKIINHFYDNKYYIEAQKLLIEPFLTAKTHVVFSYHGIPKAQIKASGCVEDCINSCPIDSHSSCYRRQCFITTNLIAKALKLETHSYSTVFQSRLGRQAWIGPYLVEYLTSLRAQGIEDILIVTPSFVADCLETLEEIAVRAAELWLSLGGKSCKVVPCLNDNDFWVEALLKICDLG